MTRHQHHSVEVTPLSQSLVAHMPAISEDDQQAELDDPPDVHYQTDSFTKARPALLPRRESLLTRALHSDSEHPYDDEPQVDFVRLPSRSSTCSTTYSGPSATGFTSDEGHNSAGTRASTPCSPPHSPLNKRSIFSFFKPTAHRTPAITVQQPTQPAHKSNAPVSTSDSSEPKVEAELGRKRCISFACGRKPSSPKPASPVRASTSPAKVDEPPAKTESTKRPCMIKFACPSKISGRGLEAPARKPSPAPPIASQPPASPFRSNSSRQHRGSDTTIQPDSPKSLRKGSATEHKRKESNSSDLVKRGTRKFYEFASSDGEEEVEEWTRNSTFPSRLTVSDTLKKENVIRKTCEEAEEEALADEAADEEDEEEDEFAFSDDEVASEAGFQTDDEDGFADSDDGEDSDSDYEWWAPRKSRSSSPYVTPTSLLPADGHESDSDSSVGSRLRVPRHKSPMPRIRKTSSSVAIRPKTPEAELPDSTDFVCGTLDEDRPLEEAFKQHVEARRAAKHKTIPQDLDPTFPTSDPEIGSSDESDGDDGETVPSKVLPKSGAGATDVQSYLPYDVSVDEDEPPRGRKPAASVAKRSQSPQPSPRRLRSPAPVKRVKSPAPHRLFDHSPKKTALPGSTGRLKSPPPSRRASVTGSPGSGVAPYGQLPGGAVFLGQRPQLTHTSSLPRSPRPFCRGSRKTSPRPRLPSAVVNDYDDDGELTAGPNEKKKKLYHRGAMDIVQGLEAKRLRRRQKFYEKYCRKEKRREERREERTARRPQPGKGAERMRQVGIECANYRSCRVLSV